MPHCNSEHWVSRFFTKALQWSTFRRGANLFSNAFGPPEEEIHADQSKIEQEDFMPPRSFNGNNKRQVTEQ